MISYPNKNDGKARHRHKILARILKDKVDLTLIENNSF
jgi:hypothetical protein